MQFKKVLFFVSLILLIVSGCGQNAPDQNSGAPNEPNQPAEETTITDFPQVHNELQPGERLVKMVTSMGDITIRLFPQYAPKTVENFITHSENGYYDGVLFHRVIEGFMVQGGDPQGTGMGGESIYGEPFEDEFSPAVAHIKGALSMANAGPNTNGSQFFIVHSDQFDPSLITEQPDEIVSLYEEHGGTSFLDYRHTVFGHVMEGMDVVDAIANVETGANDRPVEDIFIEKIEVLN